MRNSGKKSRIDHLYGLHATGLASPIEKMELYAHIRKIKRYAVFEGTSGGTGYNVNYSRIKHVVLWASITFGVTFASLLMLTPMTAAVLGMDAAEINNHQEMWVARNYWHLIWIIPLCAATIVAVWRWMATPSRGEVAEFIAATMNGATPGLRNPVDPERL